MNEAREAIRQRSEAVLPRDSCIRPWHPTTVLCHVGDIARLDQHDASLEEPCIIVTFLGRLVCGLFLDCSFDGEDLPAHEVVLSPYDRTAVTYEF